MSSFKYRSEKNCLNCGHLVEEKFCSRCGQENVVVKEKAWQMVTHAVADYFHFEHKFFATMRPLLLRPGKLTKEYVDGKRASFIHPIRLYIFISIVFFLVVLDKSDFGVNNNVKGKDVYVTRVNLKHPAGTVSATKVKDDEFDLKLERTIDSATKANEAKKAAIPAEVKQADTTYEAYLARVDKLPKNKQPGFLKKYMAKYQIKFSGVGAGQAFVEALMHNVPKMMFILLPLFAMMLHLTYYRKKKYYYEYLIYSFHVHACIFLSILLVKLVIWIIGFAVDLNNVFMLLLMIYIVWYIYRSLRVFYGSTRWRTIFKMIFLFFSYTVLLSISFLIIAAFTAIAQ